MPNFTDLTGLASVASATAAAVLLLPGISRLGLLSRALLPGVVFVLMLIPFGGMPLAAYVRGVTGDLSITALLLLWCALLRPWFDCGATDSTPRQALLMLIALAALVFYPMALGAGAFDPYRLGYGDVRMLGALLALALTAWYWRLPLVALCIALATLAWASDWHESTNLWDYLLDPFVSIYALAAVMLYMGKSLAQRKRMAAQAHAVHHVLSAQRRHPKPRAPATRLTAKKVQLRP